ncbi:MAG TPA: glycosyltransferase family 39 protein [Noviherbaspirillum sp.]
MEKTLFILSHYVQLLVFALSCAGVGAWLVRFAGAPDGGDRMLRACLSTCAGMGVLIVALQALGVLGLLTATSVRVLLVPGLILFFASLLRPSQFGEPDGHLGMERNASSGKAAWFHVALALVLAVELFLRPLTPPTAWDELMYHLPHAREWAASGALQVNEFLRFPLFPYNFNLLYAGSLAVSDDILPHMLHALAGMLVAVGLYRVAASRFNRAIASVAVLLFIAATRIEFGNAYVDLGLTAFLFFGLVCLLSWYETDRLGALYLAAFLFGVAAGIKHQALVFAPFVLAAVLWRERRPARLACFAILFATPCAYWYVRSFLVSGDPLHPLGAAVFGYWHWGPQDTANVIADIKRVYGWPSASLLPALVAVVYRHRMPSLAFRATLAFSAYAFVAWMLTSHYPRYLLPAYPALCLLSAIVLCDAAAKFVQMSGIGWAIQQKGYRRQASAWLKGAFIVGLGAVAVSDAMRQWRNIHPSEQGRAAFLRERIQSYEIAEFLQTAPGYRLVQIGLESDMYYLPSGTQGDVFGTARYSDLLGLTPAELAAKVRSLGANALLVSAREAAGVTRHEDFGTYFHPVKKSAGAELYRIR